MTFSKTFSYALRGILYVSLSQNEKRKVSIDEIAGELSVPRYFLGKIMKRVVKAGILSSIRGQQGGFYINETTLDTTLLSVISLTEGKEYFDRCLLSLGKCNAGNPCPLHSRISESKNEMLHIYGTTTIGDLVQGNRPELIHSITTVVPV
ncbi:MAG TPA: Rrf2 family transcriptional regulator [Chitinophagaceae bacterium]|nr:Rrf2 family transcriptional regulator [Chitinophagaceae bacterium]